MNDSTEKTIGLWGMHAFFDVPGWNIRDMGMAGIQCQLDWARNLGFNAITFMPTVQRRVEDSLWSLPERRRMFHSMLAPRPPFGPGDIVYPGDPLLDTPQTRRNEEIQKGAVQYASDIGLKPVICLLLNVGSPTFVLNHPELHGAFPDDFVHEGMSLCPNKSVAEAHLLDLWGRVVDAYPHAGGFVFLARDGGGCECKICRVKLNPYLDIICHFHEMIHSKRADADIYLSGWGFLSDEIEILAGRLPKDLVVLEPSGIHYPGHRPEEEHLRRIRSWRSAGMEVHAHVEAMENATYLLPACYPNRIEHILRIHRNAGIENTWASSTLHTFVYPLNFYVFTQLLRHPEKTAEEVTEEFLAESLGANALPEGLEWAGAMEECYERLYSPTQRGAFPLPLHTTFVTSIFPTRWMNEAVPPEVTEDIHATVCAAERAVSAAQRMAGKGTWQFHALETNIVLVSAKFLLCRILFRQAKLPVLEAIRVGDLEGAVQAFSRLTTLARDMVETAEGAPNTQLLNTHWTKLSLLSERLEAVKLHLPALVEMKRMRGLFDDEPIGVWTPSE